MPIEPPRKAGKHLHRVIAWSLVPTRAEMRATFPQATYDLDFPAIYACTSIGGWQQSPLSPVITGYVSRSITRSHPRVAKLVRHVDRAGMAGGVGAGGGPARFVLFESPSPVYQSRLQIQEGCKGNSFKSRKPSSNAAG